MPSPTACRYLHSSQNDGAGLARGYHWHSAAVRDFTSEPHTAIMGESVGTILNLPDLSEARTLEVPQHHEVRADNVDLESLGAVLAVAYEREFRDFASPLWTERTVHPFGRAAEDLR